MPDSAAPRPRLGELLMESGGITQEQLDESLEVSRSTGNPLGHVLVENGLVSPPRSSGSPRPHPRPPTRRRQQRKRRGKPSCSHAPHSSRSSWKPRHRGPPRKRLPRSAVSSKHFARNPTRKPRATSRSRRRAR